uniref:ATP synthase complex subunit 8 n=1 Tax=Rhinatrema nigrum TaxID=650640 RepID=C9D8C4_9AMPH|nr:ATP synthase F0 subunit 8 [Rhinatrema nigrum]
MPQLNPNPWFIIMLFSWLIFLMMIPTKIVKHQPMNATTEPTKTHDQTPWIWPWH